MKGHSSYMYMYLSGLMCYTLEYPLNGWYIEVNVVR